MHVSLPMRVRHGEVGVWLGGDGQFAMMKIAGSAGVGGSDSSGSAGTMRRRTLLILVLLLRRRLIEAARRQKRLRHVAAAGLDASHCLRAAHCGALVDSTVGMRASPQSVESDWRGEKRSNHVACTNNENHEFEPSALFAFNRCLLHLFSFTSLIKMKTWKT